MSLWEYKVITSGRGGFARPDLMEKFLNDLGRDEWEIIQFHTAPDNFLVFTGLARRSTQRDWTLEDAAAAAAKAEAEKLRAEFEAKFKAANQPGGGAPAEERQPSFLEEKAAPDDGFRKPVDTSRDDDPAAAEEDDDKDDWDKLTAAEEDELPTFFEAIKPHMRRNQRGPGMSVGVDYLAKKWDQNEDDVKAALAECGFVLPEDEDSKAEYLEYDGDLYWLNINRRGELWINTKEKPRPIFRSVKAQKVVTEEEPAKAASTQSQANAGVGGAGEGGTEGASAGAAVDGEAKAEGQSPKPEGETAAVPEGSSGGGGGDRNGQERRQGGSRLPEGAELLRKIRPHMRRNRRGPGGSGSSTFLARALRVKEDELKAAFVTLGLTMPGGPNDKPVYTEFSNELWWLNLDSRGGLWINGREKRQGETIASANAESVAPSGAQGEGGAEQPGAVAESVPGSAAPDAAPAPEVAPSVSGGAETGVSVETGGAAQSDGGASGGTAPEAKAQPESVPADASERAREVAPMPAETAPAETTPAKTASSESGAGSAGEKSSVASASAEAAGGVLAGVRPLLKETRSGGIAGKVERLAEELGKPTEELIATLVGAGLKVPEKAREKPVFVEHAGEMLWLNRNPRGDLWLNVKPAKAGDEGANEAGDDDAEGESDGAEPGGATASEGGEGEAEKKPKRVRTRRKTE